MIAPQIAIEFDGPSHYLTELKGREERRGRRKRNGRTNAKRRLLEQMGWKVVNVNYLDVLELERVGKERIEEAGGVRELKKQYARFRLADVGVVLRHKSTTL